MCLSHLFMDKTIQSGIKNGIYRQWRTFLSSISQCCMSVMNSQFIRTPTFFFTWKVVFIYIFIDLFSFCIYFIAKEVTLGSFAPLLCVFRRHQSRLSHHLTGQVNTGAGIIKAIRSPLSLGLARLQISVPLHQKCLQELCASGSSSLSGTAASRHSPFRRTGGRRGHRDGRNRSWTLPALNRRHTSIWGIYLGVQQWPHTRSPRSLCWIFLTWCRCPTAPWKAKRRFLMEASCGVSKIEVRKKRFFFQRYFVVSYNAFKLARISNYEQLRTQSEHRDKRTCWVSSSRNHFTVS